MGTTSTIRWTQATWNNVFGCDFYSVACQHCYAAGITARYANIKGNWAEGLAYFDDEGNAQWTGKLNLRWDKMNVPKSWKSPKLIFCNSMGDIFHKDVPDEFILETFRVMLDTPRHTYQVLTKRSRRLVEFCAQYFPDGLPTNIWLGVSVGHQPDVEKALDLVKVNAPVRWLSLEPLVGPVVLPKAVLDGLNWAVCGGESGAHARRMDYDWARALRDQCKTNGRNIPFFYKQGGMFDENGIRHQGKHFDGFEYLDGVAWQEYPTANPKAITGDATVRS